MNLVFVVLFVAFVLLCGAFVWVYRMLRGCMAMVDNQADQMAQMTGVLITSTSSLASTTLLLTTERGVSDCLAVDVRRLASPRDGEAASHLFAYDRLRAA